MISQFTQIIKKESQLHQRTLATTDPRKITAETHIALKLRDTPRSLHKIEFYLHSQTLSKIADFILSYFDLNFKLVNVILDIQLSTNVKTYILTCTNELEKRISAMLEHVTVDDLLVLSFTYDGERLSDLESVRRIISGFVEKEKSVAVFNAGDFKEAVSTATQRVAKTVDAYLGEIAIQLELTISKFNGIVMLVPKAARKVDDDLYRAVDIYLKAHPNLDEIEREKVCSVMDPLKLSYEARLHASQNKRLPVQIVLHALYYDQLKPRSGVDDRNTPEAATARKKLQADVSL